MTRTVADASRDYRKRRADRLGRYEAALRDLAKPYPSNPWFDLNSKDEAVRVLSRLVHASQIIAAEALNPEK